MAKVSGSKVPIRTAGQSLAIPINLFKYSSIFQSLIILDMLTSFPAIYVSNFDMKMRSPTNNYEANAEKTELNKIVDFASIVVSTTKCINQVIFSK